MSAKETVKVPVTPAWKAEFCSHFLAGELNKSNAARKDAELQELRRVVAAKEKSIDSLRTQLATAKGSLEAYTQESEAIMQQRDGEVS